ncbi:MAG: SDR family oxidoreductase [Pseudomonadota bacterium]
MKTLLSIGHGFSARYVEDLLRPKGWTIIATTRKAEKAEAMRARGLEAVIWPGEDLTPWVAKATHVLTSVSPNEDGDPVLNQCADALRSAKHLKWVGYLSTTGVYGDHQGGWVDEDTALTPSTKRGKLRVMAEAAWAELDLPLHIFRLAGIYGPGRGPFSKVRNGTARRIIKENQLFSRIHGEDIGQIVVSSINQPNPGAVYNLCDDMAAPPEDVIAYAAELLGMPIPPAVDYETADMTPMARSFYAESKRVRNDKIKSELGVTLKYPDYKIGLKALLEEETKKASE